MSHASQHPDLSQAQDSGGVLRVRGRHRVRSMRLERRNLMKTLTLVLAIVVSMVGVAIAQQPAFDRLPVDALDVMPPSARVTGTLGDLDIRERSCRSRDLTDEGLRRRIVDVAVQEWSFFGFTVVDYSRTESSNRTARRSRRGWSLLNPTDALRVADSIAGYWTVTPEGEWIIENQNQRWNRSGGETRWRTPWSAAFVSWVMCESGLSAATQFRRAVAHHTYIDQAIRARDGVTSSAAFTAHDIGEAPISPGDLLCSGRRPAYRSLAERRRQMGTGARTHCDVVVGLDVAGHRILAIGGNVRSTVGLKLLPAASDGAVGLHPKEGARPLFAHLRLRAEPILGDALESSPTIRALTCGDRAVPAQLATAGLIPLAASAC